MRPFSAMAVVAIAPVTALPAQQLEKTRAEYPPLEFLDVAAGTFRGPRAPQVTLQYEVYLPKGYDDPANAERRYPWVLWLGDRFRWPLAPVLDRMRKAGDVPDLVVFVPSAGDPFWQNGGNMGDLEDLLVADFVPHVRERHRVLTDARGCAVIGVHQGGHAAMRTALRHPDVFGSVAVHQMPPCPADPTDLSGGRWGGRMTVTASSLCGNPIDRERWKKEIPLAILAEKDRKPLGDLRIYFEVAKNDAFRWEGMTAAVSEAMDELEVVHEFRIVDGGGVGQRDQVLAKAVPRLFEFAASGFGFERRGEAGKKR